MSSAVAIPLLTQDGSSLDWRKAECQVDVAIHNQTARARFQLSAAPELQTLLDAGDAEWALEVRCPRTLYAAVTCSRQPAVTHEWPRDATNGALWILPSLVTVRACEIDPSGLNELWGPDPIPVPAGRWLVRANPTRTESLAASLLTFRIDPGLEDGEMRVDYQTSSGDLTFIAFLSRNHFERQIYTNRDVQIAALIAAFGRIPHIDSEDGDAYPILKRVKVVLQDSEVPLWGEGIDADYDPARAATAIERFTVAPVSDELL